MKPLIIGGAIWFILYNVYRFTLSAICWFRRQKRLAALKREEGMRSRLIEIINSSGPFSSDQHFRE